LQSTGDEALDKSEIAASVNIVELEHSSSVPAVFTIPHETSVDAKLNNAFIRKSTTNYTLDSVKGSPYTLSSDGRTVEDHASIEL
jgi:hypothetical protein